MDEIHVKHLDAALAALTNIEGLPAKERDCADDIIRAGFDTAVVINGDVVISKESMRIKAKSIARSMSDAEAMKWLSEDPLAAKRVEEFVISRRGWTGFDLAALLRDCREYALVKIVYAALTSARSVSVK